MLHRYLVALLGVAFLSTTSIAMSIAASESTGSCEYIRPICECTDMSVKACTNAGLCATSVVKGENVLLSHTKRNRIILGYLESHNVSDMPTERLAAIRTKAQAVYKALPEVWPPEPMNTPDSAVDTSHPDFLTWYVAKIVSVYITDYIGDGCTVGIQQLVAMTPEEKLARCDEYGIQCITE